MTKRSGEKSLMQLEEVLSAVEGALLSKEFSTTDFCFTSVAADSRNCTESSLFIPLVGSVDGHDFIEKAFDNGARTVFVNEFYAGFHSNEIRSLSSKGMCVISVSHTMYALQKLAAAYLSKFASLKRIGITGSSGKTTTKEILVSLLSQKYSVVCNEGNFNSETGLPLSVFSVREYHEYGVFEMGMNRKGEIGELAAVLKPHYGIITNIGTAHIGILGTKAAIAEEKKRIFSFFTKNSCAVIPADDDYAEFLCNDTKGTIRLYGDYNDLEITDVKDEGLLGTSFVLDQQHITFPLPGTYNFKNALAALTVALQEDISTQEIKKGLESIKPLFGRSEILSGEITIIQDCYNANPDSMREACSFFESLQWNGKKWYVLGDMLELGDDSETAHREVGTMLTSSDAAGFFLTGSQMAFTHEELLNNKKSGVVYAHNIVNGSLSDFIDAVCRSIEKNDLVLIKGSRGMKLERVTEKLSEVFSISSGSIGT